MPILLFDIDGTLVRSGGSGKAAMEAALRTAFGLAEIDDSVSYSGRTDRAIARDLLRAHGVAVTIENERKLTGIYLELLPAALRDGQGVVCPGVEPFLAEAHPAPGVLLGLLTGNNRRGAETKLSHFGLWQYFAAGGGFGDDHYDRDDVARAAVTAMVEHHRPAAHGDEVWVIGDTPLDIACARAVGAKAVAVATGWHTVDELAAHNPDALFEDMTHAADLTKRWLG